jgi:gamma-carbonic anhydrase
MPLRHRGVGRGAFLATGASVFPGARIGPDVEVPINAVVHVDTEVPAGVTVPIGWVAVGAPAQLFPPGDHEGSWAIQEQLDFPETVYGLPRDHEAAERMARQTAWFGAHRDDETIPGDRASWSTSTGRVATTVVPPPAVETSEAG